MRSVSDAGDRCEDRSRLINPDGVETLFRRPFAFCVEHCSHLDLMANFHDQITWYMCFQSGKVLVGL